MSRILVVVFYVLVRIAPADAHLSLSPIVISFEAGAEKRKDFLLENTGERPQYLEVQAQRILNLGASPELYETSPIPDAVGLLVAPRRLVLQPGEQKRIRVILLEDPPKTDLAWRVEIVPVIGEVGSSIPVALTMVGYKALVFARPNDPIVEIVGDRVGQRVSVTNAGTSNGLLHSGEQCSPPRPCVRVPGKRLWPGMTWQTQLPNDAPVTFTLTGPRGDRAITF